MTASSSAKAGSKRGEAVLRHADQGRGERLVGAALGRQRDAGRRGGEQETRILVAGIVQRIEAAGDERDRTACRPGTRRPPNRLECDRPSAASARKRFILGDAELEMLAGRAKTCPISGVEAMLLLPEGVGHLGLRGEERRGWLTQAPRLVETVTSGEVVIDPVGATRLVALADLVHEIAEGRLGREPVARRRPW
jgi:hypothetical protein